MKDIELAPVCFLVCFVLLLLAAARSAFAEDFEVTWELDANAAGYHVEMSVDDGATWTLLADVTAPPVTVTLPETGLVLLRVCGYTGANPQRISCRGDVGSWYNAQLTPGRISGVGIR